MNSLQSSKGPDEDVLGELLTVHTAAVAGLQVEGSGQQAWDHLGRCHLAVAVQGEPEQQEPLKKQPISLASLFSQSPTLRINKVCTRKS